MPLTPDYEERVYAGVLGKLIGVYLGRPFEGWSYQRIMDELGPINYYVHDRLDVPLVVTDDDISGTFTFLRALPDYGNRRDLTPAQIGQTWLNYIIENKTILWWGGLGNSTEHTAFLRLKRGIAAPRSGSSELNTQIVAEQIGSQIFIDGWAMVAPGDPELAADLARRASSVSHDGAAIHGAQVLAAMEAQAFVESDLDKLIDVGLSVIPADALIARMITDIREWHATYSDWRATRECIEQHYGYHIYGGNCHMVPNHALIHLGLLYGQDDLQRALMITNTAGWDTDCNSGNVGCLLGIKNGLAGIDSGPDWRGPVADRLYLPTADGGRAVTDAVRETLYIVNSGRALAGEAPLAPKNGARFHWELPGSVQGWQPDQGVASKNTTRLENVKGHSQRGQRSLALRYQHLAPGRVAKAATPTFIPPEVPKQPELGPGKPWRYRLYASPTLYSGQHVRMGVEADVTNETPVICHMYVQLYGAKDEIEQLDGPDVNLEPGAQETLNWTIPDTGGAPICAIGIAVHAHQYASGSVYLDYVTWDDAPNVVLGRPAGGGTMWRRAWVDAVDHFDARYPEPYRLVQDEGTGLISQGTSEWTDYRVSAPVTPHMLTAGGIAARVQGLHHRYDFLLAAGGMLRLVKVRDTQTMLAEQPFAWQFAQTYALSLEVRGSHVRAWIDDQLVFDVEDNQPLTGGGVALVCTEGRMSADAVTVQAVMNYNP